MSRTSCLITLFLVVCLLPYQGAAREDVRLTTKDEQLKGRVKSMKSTVYLCTNCAEAELAYKNEFMRDIFKYDSLGNLVYKKMLNLNRSDSVTNEMYYRYDTKNRLCMLRGKALFDLDSVCYVYEASGRLTKTVEHWADGKKTVGELYRYNKEGRLTEVEGRNGRPDRLSHLTKYNTDEQVIESISFGSGSVIAHNVYRYENGKLSEELDTNFVRKEYKKTLLKYNAAGLQTAQETYENDTLRSKENIVWNSAGNMAYQVVYDYHADGSETKTFTRYSYNDRGLLTKRITEYSSGSSSWSDIVVYSDFDSNGNYTMAVTIVTNRKNDQVLNTQTSIESRVMEYFK